MISRSAFVWVWLWLVGNLIFAQCPSITGIMINSCGGNGTEGQDEFFTFKNGSNPLDINTFSVQFPAGGTFCNSGCGGNLWQIPNANTANNIASLSAGCPGLLLEPPGGIIPPNAWVTAFVGANPNFAYNFCGSCNTGPIYVIFTSSNSTVGKFSNTQARTLIINFGPGCIDSAFYDPAFFVPNNTDGNYVMYDPVTGSPTYTTQACPSCIPLPGSLLSFQLQVTENKVNLNWIFDAEHGLPDQVMLERSFNGLNFTPVAQCNEEIGITNTCKDEPLHAGLVYYRLQYRNLDGSMHFSQTLKARINAHFNTLEHEFSLYPNPGNEILNIEFQDFREQPNRIEILDPVGRVVFSGNLLQSLKLNTAHWAKGLYIIRMPGLEGASKIWLKH